MTTTHVMSPDTAQGPEGDCMAPCEDPCQCETAKSSRVPQTQESPLLFHLPRDTKQVSLCLEPQFPHLSVGW